MKKILIAIPTARYIEAETFKSIYDLEVPEGYEVTFQYFYGYRVDQVRNLIADWVVRGFDYLFSVDHDITFLPDTLKKLLDHDQDLVSGVYRQRLEPQMLEIYEPFGTRMTTEDLYEKDRNLVGIGGCGFGCVLVKKEVLVGVGYPQFEYHHALNHNDTISEDTDFCKKAIAKGFSLWCDPSVRCGHIGSTTMHVQIPEKAQKKNKPEKAYIIRTRDPRSITYSEVCAESCDRVGMPYEFWEGHYYKTPDELWTNDLYVTTYLPTMVPPAASCTATHYDIWKRIVDNNECAIILEHDAVMLHSVDIEIPDGVICALGYKFTDITVYDHVSAGPPKEIISIDSHQGAHSYCITAKTAQMMLEELKQSGSLVAIDNSHFNRDDDKYSSKIELAIVSPTPCIGWLRESTIWADGALEMNAPLIDSFKQYYIQPIHNKLKELYEQDRIPQTHVDYLRKMKDEGTSPKVIYDIGACVLNWTNKAKEVWPDAMIVPIEAMEEVSALYKETDLEKWVSGCILSDREEEVEFYQNLEHPAGNSLYKENVELSPMADQLFPEDKKIKRRAYTLDSIVKMFDLPTPDMIKMDIQGAELKALKGATETLKTVEHLILELQHVDYNFGAPKADEVIDYLKENGFDLVGKGMFCGNPTQTVIVDGDYHFRRRQS